MNELEETIIYDTMVAIQQNAEALHDLIKRHGSDKDALAYQDGVYDPCIKLQILLGSDAMERGQERHNNILKEVIEAERVRIGEIILSGIIRYKNKWEDPR